MATTSANRNSINQPSLGGLSQRGSENININQNTAKNSDKKDSVRDPQNTSGLAIGKYNQEQAQPQPTPINPIIENSENINPSFISKKQQDSGIQELEAGSSTQKPFIDASGSNFGLVASANQHTAELKKMLTTAIQPGITFRAQLVFSKCGEYQLVGQGQGNIAYACKRLSLLKTIYDMAIVPNEMEPNRQAYLGRMTSNFVGSKFDVSDKPDAFSNLTIQYDSSCSFDNRPVRSMKVSHLRVGGNGYSETSTLLTDPPKYDPSKNVYHMNMEGRAQKGSVHNFRLMDEKERKKVFLLGKFKDGSYNIDACYPLTPLQAFSIAISSLTYKLCSK